ncbi:MAG TPA: DUF302 domain-containing protein [Dongiaceae bacterium]|nr:DUF302 domain-containing protein [Dongiaceae bacterium]
MSSQVATTPPADLRDYLAAERTFLAWIRTGLSLMGFGFVVARFGLFLQQIRFTDGAEVPRSYGLSLWFGTALILVGVVVSLGAVWRHVRLTRRLDRGELHAAPSLTATVLTAVFLALVGLAMAIYLLSVRNSGASDGGRREGNSMSQLRENGIVERASQHSVEETVQKIEAILQAKGVQLFAVVDHSREAEKVGLKMPATKLLIFGNPKAGTPVMLAAPSAAIDLPLKILVREDSAGRVWIAYNSPEWLRERHGFSAELLGNLRAVEAVAQAAGQ